MCPCAVNACVFQRVKVPPGKGRLPSSNRSGGGGNEFVGAFDGKDHWWSREDAGRNANERSKKGLETLVVEADLTDTRGMQHYRGREAMIATLEFHRGRE